MLLLLTVRISFSQSARFRQLSVDDGLSQNSVFAITQDKQGFIWIGTVDGLNKYDGKTVKNFQPDEKDSTSLSSGNIVCLLADDNNNLWVGTRGGGLNRIDLVKNKIHRLKTDTSGNGHVNSEIILALHLHKNLLYIGTATGGLNILDTKTNKVTYIRSEKNVANSLQSDMIRTISEDKNGVLWMGHPRAGVTAYNPATKKCRRINGYNDGSGVFLNNEVVRAIFVDSKNRVWISTWSGGLNVYHQDENKMYSNNVSVIDDYFKTIAKDHKNLNSYYGNVNDERYAALSHERMIYGFAEDAQGNIWIATVEEGLTCFNPNTGRIKKLKNNPNDQFSLCDNNLLSLFIDRSGLIWLGSLSSGISVFNPYTYRFGHYKANTSDPNSISNSQVWALHKGEKTGKIYIGIMGGVYVFDIENNRFIKYTVDKNGKDLLHTQAICQGIQEDKDGNLWIAVNGSGMYKFDTVSRAITNYHPDRGPDNLGHNTVLSIDMNSTGELFFSLIFRGIDRYNKANDNFTHFSYDPEKESLLTSDDIKHIQFDNSDRLWIATDSGINILDKNNSMSYIMHDEKKKGSLPDNDVISIYHGRNNTTWVGTSAGLSEFDSRNSTFSDHSGKYHFAEDGVVGITEDNSGNLWLLVKRGIIRYNKKDHTAKKFDFSDGLQGNEFPFNTILGLGDGHILIGGNKGLNYFNPDELMENKSIPGVVITEILLRDEKLKTENDVNFTEEIVLDYDHYFFTIEFSALDFVNPAKNQYKYKLEGFNDEWVKLGFKNQVTFVNLDPGEYIFTVSGSNNDGVWNEKGASIKIIITPPFWQTTWFYILCGIVIAGSGYSYIKYRESKLRKEKQLLEGKVEQRTSELREEKEKVEEAHKEITDSINYARKIQSALLPSDSEFKKIFPDSFVLFRPKNIVSGDFFWIERIQSTVHSPQPSVGSSQSADITSEDWRLRTEDCQLVLFAVADCTGHGVPGGFMSMLGTSFLKEIVNERKIKQPAEILNQLREKVIDALKQKGIEGENKDGMDIAICSLEFVVSGFALNSRTQNSKPELSLEQSEKTQNSKPEITLSFSGANNPLWIVKKVSGFESEESSESQLSQLAKPLARHTRHREQSLVTQLSQLTELKPDKMPIGYYYNQQLFSEQKMVLEKGDMIYIFSDGFADQFGGQKGKKFKYKPLQQILTENAHLPAEEQLRILNQSLDGWMGDLEQNDDITLIGIRI